MSFTQTQRKLLVLVLASLWCAIPLWAQEDLPGTLSEVIDVRVVNIEAVVTDRDGVRVHGLTTDDFRLYVDGEEVPIDYFTEIRGGDAILAAEAPVEGIPAVAPGEALGTSYLVFIDEVFTVATDRKRVLQSLADDLAFLGENDRMAVVAWDGRRLEMLTSWSQQPSDLARALETAIERPAFGLHRLAELRNYETTRGFAFARSLRFRGRPIGFDRLEIDERFYVELLTRQVEDAVTAASSTLRSFASPPGRKVMLVVSGGWPYAPADYAVGTLFRPIFEPGLLTGEEIYSPLAETANLLGYTLYPVDAPGLGHEDGRDASVAFPSVLFRNQGSFREHELHASLLFLADETGGKALLNGGRTHGLEEAYSDTRSFYWLGFTPERVGDDQHHDIRLDVNGKGLKVRTRRGFSDFSRQREISMAVESALLFGNPASSTPLVVELGEPQPSGRGKMELPLTVTIPTEAIALLPSEEELVARLELRIAVVDQKGNRAEIPVIPIVVRRSEPPASGDVLTYETTLRLRRRPHDMVVAVYDQASGAMFSAAAEVGQ